MADECNIRKVVHEIQVIANYAALQTAEKDPVQSNKFNELKGEAMGRLNKLLTKCFEK